jgi:hypothetical protein
MTRPLGDLVVARGLADASIVARAVERQQSQAKNGVFKRLGEVLVDEGILSTAQVTELLALQGKAIRVCPVCFSQYNVDELADASSMKCGRCGRELSVPEAIAGLAVEDDLSKKPAPSARDVLQQASAEASDSQRLRGVGDRSRRFGEYEILGEISRGGMGIVYKARQPAVDRIVALKVLLDPGSAGAEGIRRFRREARAVSRLRHPSIVAVHDVGVVEGINYFSMDFIEGLTLDRAVTTEGLDHRAIAAIFKKVCDAVHYAHLQGVVHRDLKPRNIIVDHKGEPTVIDFGIARLDTAESGESQISGEHGQLTKSGEILGSPAYLAPEYITGEVPDYDQRCDVWSLGACLYSALSGRAPHAEDDTIRIIRHASTADAPSIRSIVRSVDRSLARIVMTAVDRNRKNRYATAQALGLDLQRWLDGEDIEGGVSSFTRWWQRVRPRVAIGFGLAASVALVWSTGYYSNRLLEQQDEAQAPDMLRERLGAKVVTLGDALLKAGEPLAAERELSDALGLIRGARRVEALYLRARARRALGKLDAAEQDEREASSARNR